METSVRKRIAMRNYESSSMLYAKNIELVD